MAIHPQAIVSPSARIAEDVEIGPWTFIGDDVEIGSGTVIHSHVVIKGPTKIGKNNKIFQFSSIGEECQDKKYQGEPTRLIIGDNNVIRESCTIHRGTVQDQGETRIGSNNLLMAYVHVAHDCILGDHLIVANNATLGGHVHIGDYVVLGGGTLVHQFCRIGAYAMSAGGSIVLRDIPAYVMASGQSAQPHGLNVEGLRRRGFSAEVIQELKRAYKTVYRQGLTLQDALAQLEEVAQQEAAVALFRDSILQSERGIIR